MTVITFAIKQNRKTEFECKEKALSLMDFEKKKKLNRSRAQIKMIFFDPIDLKRIRKIKQIKYDFRFDDEMVLKEKN